MNALVLAIVVLAVAPEESLVVPDSGTVPPPLPVFRLPPRIERPRDTTNVLVITITEDFQFHPATLYVPVGSTITWRNQSKERMTITNVSGLALDKSSAARPAGALPFHKDYLLPGESYRQSFPIAGIYRYFCLEHERDGMVGEIIAK